MYLYTNKDRSIACVNATPLPLSHLPVGAMEHQIDEDKLAKLLPIGVSAETLADLGYAFDGETFTAATPPPAAPAGKNYTLDEFREHITQQIKSSTAAVRTLLAGTEDPAELANYTYKRQRAARIIAETATQADLAIQQAEIKARDISGETVLSLAQRQLQKAAVLERACAELDGLKKSSLARAAVALTQKELSVIGDECVDALITIQTVVANPAPSHDTSNEH